MLTSKSTELLKFLLDKKDKILLKEIAEYLKLSERSIRYEIEKIKEVTENEEFEISLNKGECWIKNYESLAKFLTNNNGYVLSPKERELYIFLKICFERKINQTMISDELDISKSTVKTHLRDIRKILEIYNLELELLPKKGLILKGEEEQLRQCVLKAVYLSKKQKSKFLDDIIYGYLKNIDKEGIKLFINYCQKLMNKIISDEAYEIILKYLVMVIYFNEKGYKIKSIKNENFLKGTQEYESVQKSKAILEGYYEIEFSEAEYLKITDYFLGSHTYNISYSYYENWVEIEIIVRNFIKKVNEELDIDISDDATLILGLVNHIKPTIYRIKNGIELENTIYEEVVESYPNLFSLVKKSVGELEKFINEKFTNDEIAFITIHFKAAIDRNVKKKKEKIKVLIVCGSGYGSSKLLAQRIKDIYKVEIVDIIPRYLLEKVNKRTNIDVILTTVPIENFKTERKIIKVSPLLTKEDIQKLDSYPIPRDSKKILFSELIDVIEKNTGEKVSNKLKTGLKNFLDTRLIDDIFHKKITIFDLLTEQRIKIKGKAKNWQEAIIEAGELLLKDDCIENEYIKEMIKVVEEFGSYILLVPNIIFPHAKSKNMVKKTAFSIVTYDKEIDFLDGQKINMVISFCSKDEREHLDGLINIIDKIEEDSSREKLMKLKTAKDIIKYFVK
ncbi:BglG family transcription antiterminator [Fusobacterium perfoetens]|uniref:BglG family transcription antiterminator n=1 Tax=Fusobacterium perfoetens TaxID=852 RepID=UPI001F18A3AD|nr:BglG family transcription antiterminator [Fusobacterium perfoetens]MCF2612182.1 BglG family transcription antiterminator [Fusobacterium perfoetens]